MDHTITTTVRIFPRRKQNLSSSSGQVTATQEVLASMFHLRQQEAADELVRDELLSLLT